MIINASGPWTDDVSRSLGRREDARVVRSKGIHLFTRAITAHHALTIPVRGRHFFVIPWRDHALIGTTDTPYTGRPMTSACRRPRLPGSDVINDTAGGASTRRDVVNAYAGLRPHRHEGQQLRKPSFDVIDDGEACSR
jgi:glycerol-3-phosphate dehydrogenase